MEETIVKINKTKSQFLEKINKIDKPLARLIKKKRKIKSTKLEMKKREVTADNAEIQRIIRDYYGQLYGNKMDNLEEMDRLLEKFNLPRLNQEDKEIMNNPITRTDIEAVINNLPKNKPSTRWLHRRILSNIQRRANAYPSKTFKKIAEEGTLPNSLYKAAITLISKPDKDNTHTHTHTHTHTRKVQANISDQHRCKYLQQNSS